MFPLTCGLASPTSIFPPHLVLHVRYMYTAFISASTVTIRLELKESQRLNWSLNDDCCCLAFTQEPIDFRLAFACAIALFN